MDERSQDRRERNKECGRAGEQAKVKKAKKRKIEGEKERKRQATKEWIK